MPDDQFSPLEAINQKFGFGGVPKVAQPDLPRVGTDLGPSAEAAPALSPLESINRKFGLSKADLPGAGTVTEPSTKAAPAIQSEDFTDKYNTPLAPEQEAKFQDWAQGRKNAAGGQVLNDLPAYDVRGRWQQLEAMSPEERAKAEAPGAHGPDTWKKPSHITFSNESKYHGAEGHEGGTWGKDAEGKDTFTPGAANLKFHGAEGLQKYFTERETGIKLLPTEAPRGLPQALAPTKEAPSLAGEVPVGGKLGLLGAVVSAARAIDPASAMTGAGIWPGPDNPVWDAPETREARAAVAQRAMEQALFPSGIPESKTLAHSVVRGISESWPTLISIIALAGYAAPLIGVGGVAAAMGGAAIPFALTGLTEEKPVAGVVKGAVLGAGLGAMHGATAAIQKPALRWLARIAGGMGIGGGSAAMAGAGAEEISRSAIIFGLFEVYGMAREPRGKVDELGRKVAAADAIDWDWMEKNKVPKETIETLKTQPVESPEFVGAVNEAAGVILDQFGRAARPTEVQQALQKQPFERNAYEKLIADQARKEGREQVLPTALTNQPLTTSGFTAQERARTEEPRWEGLSRKVEIAGDTDAARKLDDILAGNQEDIANLFRQPSTPGLVEIIERFNELARQVDETGDPTAARQLHDHITSNLKALKGLPRWPLGGGAADMVTRPAAPVSPAGRSNVTPTPPEAVELSTSPAPKATPAPEPPSSAPARAGGGGTVGLSAVPAGEKPVVPVVEPTTPAAPMGTSGSAAEEAARTPVAEPIPAPTLAPGAEAPPEVLGATEGAKKEGVVPQGRLARALETGNLPAIIRLYGGFRSDSELIKNFEPEERKLIYLFSKKGEPGARPQGPDELAMELRRNHPEEFGHIENGEQLLREIANKNIYKPATLDKMIKDWEEGHAELEFRAAEEGIDKEALARIEADGERELAAERGPISGEGGAGEEFFDYTGTEAGPTKYAVRPGEGEDFALRPGAPPESRLATRLTELQSEYPDINRDQASIVLRTFPEAGNDQVANMVADPEMFRRMVESTKTAAGQVVKGGEVQPALPGMRGDTLFRAGEEAAFTRSLTTEDIKSRLGNFGTVSEVVGEGRYNRGWLMKLKNGQMVMVFEAKDGTLELGTRELERVNKEYASLGIQVKPEDIIAGSHKPMSFGSLIELARGEGVRTFDHENWHMVKRWALTDKERAAVIRKYGENEENQAEAYARWDPKTTPDTIFAKIQNFFKTILKALTGYTSAEDVFAKVRSGEMFGREPVERRLPEGLAPTKARIAQEELEGERPWGMVGGIKGTITGNKEAAQAHYRGVKDTLSRLFWPDRRTEQGRGTYQIIVGRQAEAHTEIVRMNREFSKFDKDTRFDDPRTREALDLYEGGKADQITDPTWKAVFDSYRPEERRQVQAIHELGINMNDLSNYVDHLWKPSEKLEQIKKAIISGRSIGGPNYFLNLRTIASTSAGMAAGLEPRFPTFAQTIMAGRAAHEKFIGAQRAVADVKKAGQVKVVKSLRDTPEGWVQYPGALGEVWTKVDRPGGLMVPKEADEATMPLGGGPERMGYEEVAGVKGWMRVGFRVGPEEVVRQFDNFVGRGLEGNSAFDLYTSSLYGIRHLQMALSGWHFLFEGINAMASRSWMGLADTIGGLFTGDIPRMAGGLGKIATAPIALPIYMKQGLKFDRALMNPDKADPHVLEISRILVGSGTRVAAETHLKQMIGGHLRDALESGPLHPLATTGHLLKTASSGLMDYVVPQGKNGQIYHEFLKEVERFRRTEGRGPTPAEEARIAFEVREHGDDVWGAVAKDNIALDATVKSLLSAVIQFPRFNIGSFKLITRSTRGTKDVLMKAVDFARGEPVRTLGIKERLALQYMVGLLFSVGMMGGLMHWAFNEKPPEKMKDYFFPATGEVMPNGAEERLQLPSYLKDAMGLWKHPFRTISAKEATFIHIITDLIENKDYWGNQIASHFDPYSQQALDVAKFVGKQTLPFVLQSYQMGAKQGLGRGALAIMGIRPVPREVANTPAQNVIDEYNQMMRASMTTKETAEKKTLKSDLMKMARDQDEAGFEEAAGAAVSEGKLTRQQVKEIVTESQAPPNMGRFIRLPLEWSLRAWDAASDYEQEQWKPYLLKKVMAEKPESLIRLREPVTAALRDLGLDEAADAVAGLTMPEGVGVDLAGLGIQKEAPEMSAMGAVDTAIAEALEAKLADKTKPKKPTAKLPKEKKRPYAALGM